MDDFEKDDDFKDAEEEAFLEYLRKITPKKPLALQSRPRRKKEAEEAIQALIESKLAPVHLRELLFV